MNDIVTGTTCIVLAQCIGSYVVCFVLGVREHGDTLDHSQVCDATLAAIAICIVFDVLVALGVYGGIKILSSIF
jgi:hypothetical protein